MFVLALLHSCPGIRIAIFSTGRRASGSLMSIVLDFLIKIPGAKERICKQNEEEMYTHCAPFDDIRQCMICDTLMSCNTGG
jgi:hypothetical protein